MKRIRQENTVKEIIENFPITRRIFETYGIMCGGNILPDKPLSFFAKMHNISPDKLIDDIQKLSMGRSIQTVTWQLQNRRPSMFTRSL